MGLLVQPGLHLDHRGGTRDVVLVEQHAFAGDEQARKLAEEGRRDWVAESFT